MKGRSVLWQWFGFAIPTLLVFFEGHSHFLRTTNKDGPTLSFIRPTYSQYSFLSFRMSDFLRCLSLGKIKLDTRWDELDNSLIERFYPCSYLCKWCTWCFEVCSQFQHTDCIVYVLSEGITIVLFIISIPLFFSLYKLTSEGESFVTVYIRELVSHYSFYNGLVSLENIDY